MVNVVFDCDLTDVEFEKLKRYLIIKQMNNSFEKLLSLDFCDSFGLESELLDDVLKIFKEKIETLTINDLTKIKEN